MRTLREIALEIEADWHPINNQGAVEALRHMKRMGLITEPYGADSNGAPAVGAFLTNAVGWKGDVARRVKAELRQMCGQPK